MAQETSIETSRETDGRRRRGQDNRARIVAAMLEIIRDGDVSPSAEQVADRADVGLRTVFRHFKDMDSLYREMSGAIEEELLTIVATPFVATDWQGKVVELVERRASAFERIAPFKHASEAIRHRSKFLAEDGDRLAKALRMILKALLPPEVAARPEKVEVLDLLLSFEAWSRLRREQDLSREQAIEVLRVTVRQILADI